MRMEAFGVRRERMHSSQLRRWLTVPSPWERTWISGSGVYCPGTLGAPSLNTSSRSRSIFRVPFSPRNSSPPSSTLLP